MAPWVGEEGHKPRSSPRSCRVTSGRVAANDSGWNRGLGFGYRAGGSSLVPGCQATVRPRSAVPPPLMHLHIRTSELLFILRREVRVRRQGK